MAQSPDTYTRWAVLASGEGGGRIASTLFDRTENPGIENRILIMNTNRADIKNTIEDIDTFSNVDADDVRQNHSLEFGPKDGAGNYFPGGEQCAEVDEDRIISSIENAELESADAFLYMTTLGGGTGNGSVPYLIRTLKQNPPNPALENTIHVAMAAWPYDFEGSQRHFNAICGLSRLLKWYDGSQNADMVILISNSHIVNDEDLGSTAKQDKHSVVNEHAIRAVDMMIGAGRQTEGVVDVSDFITWPSRLGVYHFTPGVALEQPDFFDLDLMFDNAADNTFVPMDPTTTQLVFAVVRAPEDLVGTDKYTETNVEGALERWFEDNGMDRIATKMATVTPRDDGGDKVDVLLLFGGFDLGELLETSERKAERLMDIAVDSGLEQDLTGDMEPFSRDKFRQIRQNLSDYRSNSGR